MESFLFISILLTEKTQQVFRSCLRLIIKLNIRNKLQHCEAFPPVSYNYKQLHIKTFKGFEDYYLANKFVYNINNTL